jgi:hypothetical protein
MDDREEEALRRYIAAQSSLTLSIWNAVSGLVRLVIAVAESNPVNQSPSFYAAKQKMIGDIEYHDKIIQSSFRRFDST